MSLQTLEDLFVHELKDLYDAEHQMIKALPKLAKAASNEQLRAGFEEHLAQTKEHAERLEQIFEQLGQTSHGVKCAAMAGLVREGGEMIKEQAAPEVKDAGLIAAAQRVEHYEIAAYGTACTFAHLLGHTEAEELLLKTLEEEKQTDEKLTELAQSEINMAAQHAGAAEAKSH